MSRNIGFTKKEAQAVAKTLNRQPLWDVFAQKEEHYNHPSYQWVVVLQKKSTTTRKGE
jgi:hypothetical protein